MNKFLAGGLALSLLAHLAQTHAQPVPRKAVETWAERGQQEMAPTWRKLGQSHKAAVFLHKEVKKAENGRVAVWTHSELPATEYLEKEKPYLSTRERMLVDCKSARFGLSEQTFYAEHFGRGAIVATNRFRNADMLDAVPDSLEETLVKTVCASKPRKTAIRKPVAPKAEAAEGGTSQGTPAKEAAPANTTPQAKAPEAAAPKGAQSKDAAPKTPAPKAGTADAAAKDPQTKDAASRLKASGVKAGT